jgi:hypothetical protein
VLKVQRVRQEQQVRKDQLATMETQFLMVLVHLQITLETTATSTSTLLPRKFMVPNLVVFGLLA